MGYGGSGNGEGGGVGCKIGIGPGIGADSLGAPSFEGLRALSLPAGRDTAPLGLEGGVCLWAFALDVTEAVTLSLAFGCAALVDLRLDLVACAYVREDTDLGVSIITAARACWKVSHAQPCTSKWPVLQRNWDTAC